MIDSTSRPTYPTSVNFDASILRKGAWTSFASRRAISVLPTPVGPIMMMFFGMTSSRKLFGQALASPAVAERDGNGPFGLMLADDVLVQFFDDLAWRQGIFQKNLQVSSTGFQIADSGLKRGKTRDEQFYSLHSWLSGSCDPALLQFFYRDFLIRVDADVRRLSSWILPRLPARRALCGP